MKTKKVLAAFFALMIIGGISNKLFAQKGDFKLGPAISLIIPTGDFSEMTISSSGASIYEKEVISHGTGFGVAAAAKYGLSDFLSVVGELGFNSVSQTRKSYIVTDYSKGVSSTSTDPSKIVEDRYNFFTITAGIRANVNFLYAEGRLGYYGGDQGGFGFVPAIGAEFNNFDLQLNYAIVGEGSNFGIRLAYYFDL